MNLLDKNSNFNILLAGIISLFIGVGVARFSYTSLLPSMLADNTLSLTFSGILASINYVGYLSGSIFAIFIKDINTKVKYFRLGIILCILTTIIMGVTTNEILWLLGRVIAGFGAAMALVVGAAIVMTKLNFQDKTKAMGIYFSGIGIALASSDIISRYVLSFSSWQNSWIVLTFCAIAVAAYPLYILSFDKEISQKNEKHPFNKALFSPFVDGKFCLCPLAALRRLPSKFCQHVQSNRAWSWQLVYRLGVRQNPNNLKPTGLSLLIPLLTGSFWRFWLLLMRAIRR